MRITIIGHASLLVELNGFNLYIDPVFFDPFETNHISCPKRKVDKERLPRADAVFFSHDHADHADFKSIGELNRDAQVFVPKGSPLNTTLLERGFSSLNPVSGTEVRQVGPFELYFTPSEDEDIELGVVVTSGRHSVWCQVDTVVEEKTVVDILRRYELGLVFATYNPLILHGRNWHQERVFPRHRYEYLLEMAVMCQAHRVVPYSSGQRCADIPEFNRMEYPVLREQFLEDLKLLAPKTEGIRANPGDILQFDDSEFRWLVGASPFVKMLSDKSTELVFSPPSSSWPPLRTRRTPRYSLDQIEKTITSLIENWLEPILQTYASDLLLEGPLRRLRDRRHNFEIVCLLEEESLDMESDLSRYDALRWHLVTWVPKPIFVKGGRVDADYSFVLSARALMDYVMQIDHQRSSIPQIRCRYRREERSGDSGGISLEPLPPPELFRPRRHFVDACFAWDPLQEIFASSGLHERITNRGLEGHKPIIFEKNQGKEGG